MQSATLVPVEAYLETQFPHGDREYLDGRILESNMEEIDHGDLQTAIAFYLRSRYASH